MKHFSLDQDLQIRRLIRTCGQQAQQLATESFQVSQKGPGDYVTNIDRWLDEQLSVGFAAMFPNDGIITEENPQSRQAFHTPYARLWCIDPLDGTEDFIHRKLEYAVMVGALQARQPVAGWIYAPATQLMYYGGEGWGVFRVPADRPPESLLNLEPHPDSPQASQMLLGFKDQQNFADAIAALIPEMRFYSLGSFGLKVMEVVQGRAGLYLYANQRVKIWDTVGPIAIARAAGLICCDLDGEPIQFTPEAIDPDSLAHKQQILIGWPRYVEAFRTKLQKAVRD